MLQGTTVFRRKYPGERTDKKPLAQPGTLDNRYEINRPPRKPNHFGHPAVKLYC